MTRPPLQGIRVVELAEVWAGPIGGVFLGDLGAEVIKVESFTRASITRPAVPVSLARGGLSATRPWDASYVHNMANRNKYGVTLDLGVPAGKALLQDLVRISDVLLESYSAGTGSRMGIDYPSMRRVNPSIIVLSTPGWGVEGPYQGYATIGSGLDAFAGHHLLRGYRDTDPSETTPVVHSDAVAAATVAYAVMVALHYRMRTGRGQWIDASQVEAFLPHLARPMMDFAMNGRLPERMENRDELMAPHGCYRCRGDDDWVAIAVETDEDWRALCSVAGHPDWAGDPRFARVASRRANHEVLDALLEAWTLGQEKGDLMARLQAAGVAAGAVQSDAEVYADPHLAARGFFPTVRHSLLGEHRYPGSPLRLGETRSPFRMPPALLGEHNATIYGDLLGLGEEGVSRLEAQRVIGDSLLPDAGLDAVDRSR